MMLANTPIIGVWPKRGVAPEGVGPIGQYLTIYKISINQSFFKLVTFTKNEVWPKKGVASEGHGL